MEQDIVNNRNKLFSILEELKNDFPAYDTKYINCIISTLKEDKDNMFLSLSQDVLGKFSFAKDPEDKFNSDKRIRIDLKSFLKKKINLSWQDMTDYMADKIEEAILVKLTKDFVNNPVSEIDKYIKVLSGEELIKFIDQFKMKPRAYSTSAPSMNFFLENSHKIKLVTFRETHFAFLWYCDNSTRVLDYVYPYGDWAEQCVYKWAKENNILLRSAAFNKKLTITLKRVVPIPVLETFFVETSSKNKTTTQPKPTIVLTNKFDLTQ